MPGAGNPPSLNGEHFYDPSFTAEITAKMQVPKRIKLGGNGDDEDEYTAQIPWQHEKIDMRVPDRILVAGEDKHIGTPAPPRELIVENTIMPPDPGMRRVQTPPRIITLDEHYFPSAADDFEKGAAAESRSGMMEFIGSDNNQNLMDQSMTNNDMTIAWSNVPQLRGDEELSNLRKQLVRMNKRVSNIERDIVSKKQRDNIIIGIATAYLILKAFIWLSRSN